MAKAFFRLAWIRQALAWIIAAWLGLCVRTIRWRVEGVGAVLADPGDGYIVLGWHSVIGLSVVFRRFVRGARILPIISRSGDGELITRIVSRLGYPAVRGSRGRGWEDKGGAAAFRRALRLLQDGVSVAVTPDGPRGPVHSFPSGPVLLAKAASARVFMLGLASAPAIRLGTWDRMYIPLPFARGVLVLRGPFRATGGPAPPAVDAAAWARELHAAQDEAEALLLGRPGAPAPVSQPGAA